MPPFLDEDEQDFFLQLAYAASHGATDELASVLKSGSVFLSSMDTVSFASSTRKGVILL